MKEDRVFGLDLMRAIAILLVVLVHGSFLLNGSPMEGFPYFKMIDGVELFFVLSGFLIGGILLKDIHGAERFGFRELMHFWKRRWFRTLPNYYLILFFNYVFVRYGVIKEDISQFNGHFLTFTHNFRTPFQGFFWESWSLSVEEWFYLFTPVLLLLLLKTLKPRWAFLITASAMILMPAVYRWAIFDAGIDHFTWDITFRKTVLCRLDSIGYGVLAAWIYRYYPSQWRRVSIPALIIGIALIAFILQYKNSPGSFYRQVIYFSIMPFAVMALMPFISNIKTSVGYFAHSIRHISKISYSMYLINLALVAEVIRDNFPPTGPADAMFKYGIFWLIVITAATALYAFYEKPIMNLRDR